MSTTKRWPEFLFYFLALAGLVGTNAQLPAYLHGGFLDGNIAFWKDTVATPAATFILVDIFVFATAVFVWMFAESRRIGLRVRWPWLYFLGSVLIGVSFAFPLFLAHRERRIRIALPEQASAPAGADRGAILFSLVLALVAVVYSLRHIPG